MNKTELTRLVSEKAELSRKDAEIAVNAVFETISESLVSGESVSVVNFGNFTVKERAARTARNLHTGETIQVPSKRVASFKVGKGLKDAVAGK